jgi:hypothetical protein
MKTIYTPEQTQEMWDELINYIDEYISSPRKEKLIEFYKLYKDRILFMPASHKKEYHNCHISGYIEHVLRVIRCSLKQYDLWKSEGVNTDTFSKEELIFSALNHDLGKIGDENYEAYITQTDNWRKEKLGEDYTFNTKLPFASVPDRGLFLLQSNGISYSFNEMIAIQTHDGLYDEANKKYLMPYMSEQKPRTALPFILHQADLMASRIEWEREWLSTFNSETTKTIKPKKVDNKTKALSSVKSEGLQNLLNNL